MDLSLFSWPTFDLRSWINRTEFKWSEWRVFDWVPPDATSNPATRPISSPCRIDMFLLMIRRTNVEGPVRAAITDLGSPIPLAAGIIDPSDAQFDPAWYSFDGGNGCIL